MNPFRISFPISDLIGMFCRLGLLEESLPVEVTVWLKEVWILPESGLTSLVSASTYVDFSLKSSRYSSSSFGKGCDFFPKSVHGRVDNLKHPNGNTRIGFHNF